MLYKHRDTSSSPQHPPKLEEAVQVYKASAMCSRVLRVAGTWLKPGSGRDHVSREGGRVTKQHIPHTYTNKVE